MMGLVPSRVTRELASSYSLPLDGVMRQSTTYKRAFSRTRPYWHLDLGFPASSSVRKETSFLN